MSKKILIVEDDSEMSELLSFTLRSAGFSVGTAYDGVVALGKARSFAPDLVILDVMLPEMDGFAVCETLRRSPQHSAVPIIMLTAMSSQLARLNGLEAGADDYMVKPFSPRVLLSRVRNLLGEESFVA